MIERFLAANQTRFAQAGFAPSEQLTSELAYLQHLIPEGVAVHPYAAVLAADGLAVMRARYGGGKDPVRSYRGEWEVRPVPALFHQIEHVTDGVEGLVRNYDNHASSGDHGARQGGLVALMEEVASYTHHDVVLGNGRQVENPSNYDERASMLQVRKKLIILGLGNTAFCGRVTAGVGATTYNPYTQRQDVDRRRGYVNSQCNVASTDFVNFASPNGPRDSMRAVIEDKFCKRVSGGWLIREIRRRHIGISRLMDAMLTIDTCNDSMVISRYGQALIDNSHFIEKYIYPAADWSLDDRRQRADNARLVRYLGAQIVGRRMSCSEAYARTLSQSSSIAELGYREVIRVKKHPKPCI